MKNPCGLKLTILLLLSVNFIASCTSTAGSKENPTLRIDIRGEIDGVTIKWTLHKMVNITGLHHTESEEVRVPVIKFYTAEIGEGIDFKLVPKGIGKWTVTLIRGNKVVKNYSIDASTSSIPFAFHYQFERVAE